MHDLIEAFSKEDHKKKTLWSIREEMMRWALRGIYHDAISCFWQEFYNTRTIGERERVPALRHDFQQNEWTPVARILVKGFLDLGYFPVMLSETFFAGVVFGESQIAQEVLLQSFKRYLAKDEEAVICQALGENDISEEFVELLDRFIIAEKCPQQRM